MLLLLLRTRLRYYRNYLRHHFDRVVWLEIGFIIAILFYLAGRSPADIGYSLKFLLEKNFFSHYVASWVGGLPIFYLIAETLAIVTLRPTAEWRIIGALPIGQSVWADYHLLRHAGKTFPLLLIGTAPFLFGEGTVALKLGRGLLALTLLLLLQFAGFMQAYRLLNHRVKIRRRLLHWLPAEAAILAATMAPATRLKNLFTESSGWMHLGWIIAGVLAMRLFFYLRRHYEPVTVENRATIKRQAFRQAQPFHFPISATRALIWRDLKFLWLEKRAAFILAAFAALIILLATLAQSSAAEAYASSIVLASIFGFMLINTLLVLFEHDVKTVALPRHLPISASACWKARWLLATGFLIAPIVGAALVIPLVFAVDRSFVFFVGLAVIIPAIFSAVFCNAGFGLFPNMKFCGVLLNILLGLMILFWFYMPLGTLMLLAISALWIRKSQRHFQFLEIA